MSGISRRFLLWQGVALAAPHRLSARSGNENVYRFSTEGWDVQMTVTFFDRYASSGFWFEERRSGRQFCVSSEGRRGSDCLPNFTGSVAVAHYRMRPAFGAGRKAALRERVRTIDQVDRLKSRPPFEGAIEVRDGIASDIQAFGYEVQGAAPPRESNATGPWCFLRQDLFLDLDSSPFLVVHWKHTLDEIRILDIIPGDRTRSPGQVRTR